MKVLVSALVAGASAFSPSAGGGGTVAAFAAASRLASRRALTALSSTARDAAAAATEEFLGRRARVGAPPRRLHVLLEVLELRGMTVVDPSEELGSSMPLVVPLARDVDGCLVGLLRWPTCPPDMELPVVKVGEAGLSLLAKESEHFIRRVASEEDFKGSDISVEAVRLANLDLAPNLPTYEAGSVAKLGYGPEKYQLLRVGPFPDVYESLVKGHLDKGDEISALSAAEKANEVFTGWGRSYGFYARVLDSRAGRSAEARDAAKVALRCPVWTITPSLSDLQEVCRLAGYDSLDSAKAFFVKLAEDEQKDKLTEGKAPAQVALDRAAHVLDAAVFGYKGGFTSAELRESLASFYEEGGLNDMAFFMRGE